MAREIPVVAARGSSRHVRPVMDHSSVDAEIAALTRIAASTKSRHEFRIEALRRLQSIVGFDSAVFCSRSPEVPATVNASQPHAASLVANFDVFADELRPIEVAARAAGGVAVDVRVLSARRRERLRFYREIVRPLGIRSMMAMYLSLVSREAGVIYCARHHPTRFDESTCRVARSLVPVLALGDAVHPTGAGEDVRLDVYSPDWSMLTRREREIVEYVALGLRNEDIATALGTSRNTVRNQLSAIYGRLGVANRTELARFAVASGVVRAK